MSRTSNYQLKTKKGAASFYIVIFTTLVISVITLSFIRIMLSEATRTTDTDLSQSAYDSALAGIEDAKSALTRCTRENLQDPSGADHCEALMEKSQYNADDESDCNRIASYLYSLRDDNKEVQISENTSGKDSREAQAYTCVKIRNKLEDYRATLSSNVRIKVVPLSVIEGFDKATSAKISWYSAQNGATKQTIESLYPKSGEHKYFQANGVAQTDDLGTSTAPVLSAELVQTDQVFSFEELISDANNTGTDRSLLTLFPVNGGDSSLTTIDASVVRSAGDPNLPNAPQYIDCSVKDSDDFACNAKIGLPPTVRGTSKNNGTAFLIITAPYSNSDVDFSITVYKGDDPMYFQGAQYAVDSTGRANDIYRRIDTRVELGNANFPYPEYVAQLGINSSDSNSQIWKNFWVTNNCQRTFNEPLFMPDKPYGSSYCQDNQKNNINSGEVSQE